MNQESIEDALRSRGEAIASLRPDRSGVEAALARAEVRQPRPPARRRPIGALAVGLACLLLGAAAATAATGLLGSGLDSFFGGGAPPGRQLAGSEVPSWLQPAPDFNAPGEVSVVASDGGESLYAYRQRGSVCFDYGHHVGECRSPSEWRRELEAKSWILRGPVGRSIWFGLVGADITSIRVEYLQGETTEVAVSDEGFVAALDPTRNPQRIVALNASGVEVVDQPLAPSR